MCVSASCIGCELALDQLSQRYSLPPPMAEELVRRCHRLNSPLQRSDEISHRAICLLRARCDDGNDGKDILDPVVKLGNQQVLLFFERLALGDVPRQALNAQQGAGSVKLTL